MRRFAAVDLVGPSRSARRQQVVFAEFVVGSIGLWVLAVVLLTHGSTLFGIAVVGLALNYSALAAHAVSLRRDGNLERELDGVDLPAELRRYSLGQIVVLLPFVLFVMAGAELARPSR